MNYVNVYVVIVVYLACLYLLSASIQNTTLTDVPSRCTIYIQNAYDATRAKDWSPVPDSPSGEEEEDEKRSAGAIY